MVAQGINMNGAISRCLPQMIHSVAFYDLQAHSRVFSSLPRATGRTILTNMTENGDVAGVRQSIHALVLSIEM